MTIATVTQTGKSEADLGSLPRPPLVKGLPLLGSVVPLLKNPHEFVKDAYKRYGEVFRFEAGPRKFTVLAGVEANRFVSGENKDLFCVDGFWGEVGKYVECPHMLVMLDGEIHQYQRKIMAPLLMQQSYKDKTQDMAANVTGLLAKVADVGAVDFGPLARQMLSNQLSQTFQGYAAPHKKVETLIYWFNSVTKVFAMRSLPRSYLKTPKVQYAEWVAKKTMRKSVDVAEERIARGEVNGYYLDHVIPRLKEKPEWFSRGDLEAHALLLFVGALDTIAATQGFMLYRMLRDPQLYARVQREVDAAFANGVPDLEGLKALEDLNGLFRETMRLQPTGFGITRNATRDFEYKGYRINKGEDLLIFTTADHLNPAYFPNPEIFDIERYRDPRNEHKQPAYAPFGKGPHNCLGASMAELIMPLHMGLMLYHLDFKPACNLDKVKVVFSPAPVLSDNFRVKVSLRKPVG